jgi:hypothetical protein
VSHDGNCWAFHQDHFVDTAYLPKASAVHDVTDCPVGHDILGDHIYHPLIRGPTRLLQMVALILVRALQQLQLSQIPIVLSCASVQKMGRALLQDSCGRVEDVDLEYDGVATLNVYFGEQEEG